MVFDPNFKIGKFYALDYFRDGSFYLLDVPGHAIGHMCGFARATATTFVLLGADACHFAGSLRPSPYIPYQRLWTHKHPVSTISSQAHALVLCLETVTQATAKKLNAQYPTAPLVKPPEVLISILILQIKALAV
jgi:hypothetical protein